MVAAGNANSESAGKKDRRDAAREKARLDREVEKRRARRNRTFLQGGIGLGLLAIVAIVALVIVNQPAPASTAGPKNMLSDGILISGPSLNAVPTAAIAASGKPVVTDTAALATKINIVTYLDFQCPFCEQFETTNSAQIDALVTSGKASLEVHPIAFLDGSSLGNRYSTRAANAAACVANYQPNNFQAVSRALYANQPPESSSGKSDAQLLSVLAGAGSNTADITACVKKEKFSPWVSAATARLDPTGKTDVFRGVAKTPMKFFGTPAVFVNGERYTGSITDPAVFAAFVTQQSS